MIDSQQQCMKYRINGSVQGVGFRYRVWREATKLALTGYVRNLADGSVEVLACGSSEQREKFFCWLSEGGVKGARVDNIFSAIHQPEQCWTQFAVRY